MAKVMNELSIRMRCPGCGAHIDVKVGDLTPGAVKRCVYCGGKVQLRRDDDGRVEQAVIDLTRSLEELSRALTVGG